MPLDTTFHFGLQWVCLHLKTEVIVEALATFLPDQEDLVVVEDLEVSVVVALVAVELAEVGNFT
jgi:hypothetical protein